MPLIKIDASTVQTITAIATSVLALLALFLSLWQAFQSRKHNKLSVRPLLVFIVNYDTTIDTNNRGIGFSVSNKGVGPALISSFRVLVDKKDVTVDAPHPWASALRLADLNYPFVQHFSFDSKTALSPKETFPLLIATPTELTKEHFLHLKKNLPRIGVVIRYRSIYGEDFVARHEGNPELLLDEKWLQSSLFESPVDGGMGGV